MPVLKLKVGSEAVFVSPTGKAAANLVKSGTLAGTVHSLIYLRDEDDFDVDANGEIIEKEELSRKALNTLKVEDISFRALGVLKNCRIISGSEMMNLLSKIKLGIDMGIIKEKINPIELLINNQRFMLMKKYGEMQPEERDIQRASAIREILK